MPLLNPVGGLVSMPSKLNKIFRNPTKFDSFFGGLRLRLNRVGGKVII